MAGTDAAVAVLDHLRELRDRYAALSAAAYEAGDYDTSSRWSWRVLGVLDAIDLVREGLDR